MIIKDDANPSKLQTNNQNSSFTLYHLIVGKKEKGFAKCLNDMLNYHHGWDCIVQLLNRSIITSADSFYLPFQSFQYSLYSELPVFSLPIFPEIVYTDTAMRMFVSKAMGNLFVIFIHKLTPRARFWFQLTPRFNWSHPPYKISTKLKVSGAIPTMIVISRYNRKGTLSAIPKTGGCSVKGPKIPRQV
ncbi:hypothetical protein OUZ56_028952 [Daphnia magna]|uniref:Uncharacterized protein n=1 Tax=Daphnia magna TaxID=35525 RepID=A0ABR0B5D4_9CRUS|nr:hypothetical protein OUZ56_028952 [Daphnia magna]